MTMLTYTRKSAKPTPADAGRFAPPTVRIQAKWTVDAPGDAYEREADQIAARIVQRPAPRPHRVCACGGGCPRCQQERREAEARAAVSIQRVQPGTGGVAVPQPRVDAAVNSPGQPLDSATRAFFEPRFGHDLGAVRVHADARAAEAARSVAATAFTVGPHIVFGAGHFAPGTPQGQTLLAHELTHSVQQGAVGTRTGSLAGPRTIQRDGDGAGSYAPLPRKTIWVNIGFDSSAQANDVTIKKLKASIAKEKAAIASCCSAHSLACDIDVKTAYDWNRNNKPAPADGDYDSDNADDRALRDKNFDNIVGHAGGVKVLVTESTLSQTWQGGRIFPRANTGAKGVLWNRALAADDTIAHESGHAAGYTGDAEGGAHSSDPHNLMSPGSVRTADAVPDTNWCQQVAATAT